MKILVTMPKSDIRDTFFPPDIVERLESIAEVEWNETGKPYGAAGLKQKIKGIDVCMTGWGTERYGRDILENADKLKILAHTGGSVATLVSDAVYEKGIHVLSGNKLYAESVAEGVIGYILCSLRRMVLFQDEMRKGNWPPTDAWYEGLLDQKVGLVGFGAVARNLVRMLAPFRVKIKAYDPYVKDEIFREYGVERASLEEIFTKSKIISLHVAQTPDTHHMIDKTLIQSIPDGALLVNTARAGIIDSAALEEELMKNRFNAVLDVFDIEPLPADSKLIGLPNVLLQPHRGGPTVDRWKIVTSSLIDGILKIYNGEISDLEISRDYGMAMTR